MDVDPNYDPSDFLMSGLPLRKNDEMSPENQYSEMKIQDDLAVSESEDEDVNNAPPESMQEEDDGGELWF